MKKMAALLLALALALSLAACGGGVSADNVTMADLCGDWVREDNGWPMTITQDAIERVTGGNGGSSVSTSFPVENGLLVNGSQEPYIEEYKIVASGGRVTRLEGDSYSYVPMERTQVNMGETSGGNSVADVTITGIAYARLLDAKTYAPVESGGGWVPDDGMVFMEITYTVKNVDAGNALEIPGGVQMTIHYGDGGPFGTEEGKYCYYRALDGTGCYKRGGSLTEGYSIELSPLAEGEYAVYIPVDEALSTDTETPMTIDLTLASGTSFAYANVKVR